MPIFSSVSTSCCKAGHSTCSRVWDHGSGDTLLQEHNPLWPVCRCRGNRRRRKRPRRQRRSSDADIRQSEGVPLSFCHVGAHVHEFYVLLKLNEETSDLARCLQRPANSDALLLEKGDVGIVIRRDTRKCVYLCISAHLRIKRKQKGVCFFNLFYFAKHRNRQGCISKKRLRQD